MAVMDKSTVRSFASSIGVSDFAATVSTKTRTVCKPYNNNCKQGFVCPAPSCDSCMCELNEILSHQQYNVGHTGIIPQISDALVAFSDWATEKGQTLILVVLYLGAALLFSLVGYLLASPARVVLPVALAAGMQFLWQKMNGAHSGQPVIFMGLGVVMLFSCWDQDRVVSLMTLAAGTNLLWQKMHIQWAASPRMKKTF